MIKTVSELLDFPVSLERSVDAKQEWKEIQTSNRAVFVKLRNIRDRQWLARHKALYFNGELAEWEGRERDRSFSGHNTYAFCMPLFLAWYFHENGEALLDAIRASVLRHNNTLDQVQQGRMLIVKATGPYYHNRAYGFFGPAAPAIVKLFYEGQLSNVYEEKAGPSNWTMLKLYLGSLSGGLHCVNSGAQWHAGRLWYPGRFMRERALVASHDLSVYHDEMIVTISKIINEKWKALLQNEWDLSRFPDEAIVLKEQTERQLREDIQSGALAGWVADIIADGIDV